MTACCSFHCSVGETSLGLIEVCISSSSSSSNDQNCFVPQHVRFVWVLSFGLAVGALALLTLTVFLFIASHFIQTSTIEYGRLTGFAASKSRHSRARRRPRFALVIFLCLSTVLFPMGFDSEVIGGSPFQLPADYRIGSSYLAFVAATWLTVVSAIIAGKMCLPRFVS